MAVIVQCQSDMQIWLLTVLTFISITLGQMLTFVIDSNSAMSKWHANLNFKHLKIAILPGKLRWNPEEFWNNSKAI